jgi:hypothetical protein
MLRHLELPGGFRNILKCFLFSAINPPLCAADYCNLLSGRSSMRLTVFLLACAASVISTSFAHATIWITEDRGGRIIDYVDRFDRARASGEQVVIDGACLSACTLAVGMLPRGQVCATPRAILGFHAAWQPTPRGGRLVSREATQAMMEVYPPELQSWIKRRGGLTPRLKLLHGRELAAIVPSCGANVNYAGRTTREPRGLFSNPASAAY